MEEKKNSSFATASMVLGIIAICTSFIPIINNLSFFLGILALIFGIVAIVKKSKLGKCLTGIILGVLSIVITLALQSSWSKSLNQLSNDLNKTIDDTNKTFNEMSGKSTDEILKNSAEVVLGDFEVSNNGYYDETKLEVKVTNKTAEKKSFSIQIEAVAADGSRITTDYVYANNLTAGQSQTFNTFEFVSDKVEALKNATFKIVEISMY